jgi:hypothetical protein
MHTGETIVSIPRRWSWAIALALLALCGLLVWLVMAGEGVGLAVGPVSAGASGMEDSTRVRSGTPVPLVARAAGSAAVEATHGTDEYEVCGGAWLKAGPDGNPDQAELRRLLRTDEARAAVDRALTADARPFSQAARLLLQMLNGDDERRRALLAGAQGCGESCPPQLAASAPAQEAAAALRDSLARLASMTTDPDTYALAYRVCGGTFARLRDGACALLSAEQWARLDPGNAAPWQEVFAAAQARRDTPAANEALHRIATSQRSDQGFSKLPGLVLDSAPDDDVLRGGVMELALETIAVELSWMGPSDQPLIAACRRDQLRDSSRRQTCDAIAELLADKSDTLLGRTMGGAIGRQAGWPEERIDRMRAEQQAFTASRFAGMDPRAAMSCASIARMTDDLRHVAALGEVGAMREWLASSAPPPDELLSRYRAERREAAERAKSEAAVAAASAASSSAAVLAAAPTLR